MKTYIITLLLGASALIACDSKHSGKTETISMGELDVVEIKEVDEVPEVEAGTYDAEKALAYGADDYGMRKYVIAFLKKGPNRDLPKAEADSLQAAHMANIGRMAEEGKLAVAGPFFDDGDLRGIYIFAVETLEEAQKLTESDPAVQAGSLVMELKEWYGSAALMAVNDIHGTLAKDGVGL